MDWFESEVRALEALPKATESIVFYGSSSIRLWSSLEADFPFVRVVNRGFGGSTLQACVHFFERLIVPLKARAMVFYAGDNDIGDGHPASQVMGDLHAFLGLIDRHLPKLPFAFLSVKPSVVRAHLLPTIQSFNASAKDLVGHQRNGIFVDVHSPMLDSSGAPRRELFDGDGLHLNSRGYALWREILIRDAGSLLLMAPKVSQSAR